MLEARISPNLVEKPAPDQTSDFRLINCNPACCRPLLPYVGWGHQAHSVRYSDRLWLLLLGQVLRTGTSGGQAGTHLHTPASNHQAVEGWRKFDRPQLDFRTKFFQPAHLIFECSPIAWRQAVILPSCLYNMPVGDLVHKLVSCGAVVVSADGREPFFTNEFRMYLRKYAGSNTDRFTVIQGWRAILAGFHISLALLSDEELLTVTTLLVFQTKTTQAAFVN